MGKKWDKALPSVDIWKECLRVLKPGAFAFVMCIPRQDCLARMIVSLEDAGFRVGFSSIYWTYASGFPKAQNISKEIEKKNKKIKAFSQGFVTAGDDGRKAEFKQKLSYRSDYGYKWKPSTPQAQALDGSFAGMQLKPAVEVILCVMKPLSEKTYVDQALKNGKGVTWLDDCRVPYGSEADSKKVKNIAKSVSKSSPLMLKPRDGWNQNSVRINTEASPHGRFPSHLLVSDDTLNDGRVRKSSGGAAFSIYGNTLESGIQGDSRGKKVQDGHKLGLGDSGSFSRYFSLDAWWKKKLSELPIGVQKTFPFLIVPKASKSEKNRGCEEVYALKNDVPQKIMDQIKRRLK